GGPEAPSKGVVSVGAHGTVALGRGQSPTCCLVPNDFLAAGDGERRELIERLYKLDDLLTLLKNRLPAQTKKLLILDVTSVAAHWPMGQFQSDFARVLQSKDYQGQIKDVPNLVVMLGSDHNQRSWAAPDVSKTGGTAFSHFLAEGLKGAARPKGQLLDVELLHAYVSERVKHWARNNRNRVQAPVLIDPHGQASKIEILVS